MPDELDGELLRRFVQGDQDAFESLFLPASLDSIIHSETVIDRIMRTRSALDSCWQ